MQNIYNFVYIKTCMVLRFLWYISPAFFEYKFSSRQCLPEVYILLCIVYVHVNITTDHIFLFLFMAPTKPSQPKCTEQAHCLMFVAVSIFSTWFKAWLGIRNGGFRDQSYTTDSLCICARPDKEDAFSKLVCRAVFAMYGVGRKRGQPCARVPQHMRTCFMGTWNFKLKFIFIWEARKKSFSSESTVGWYEKGNPATNNLFTAEFIFPMHPK
jgi:hypothetical protein